jgi:hypothetical protein
LDIIGSKLNRRCGYLVTSPSVMAFGCDLLMTDSCNKLLFRNNADSKDFTNFGTNVTIAKVSTLGNVMMVFYLLSPTVETVGYGIYEKT